MYICIYVCVFTMDLYITLLLVNEAGLNRSHVDTQPPVFTQQTSYTHTHTHTVLWPEAIELISYISTLV